MRYCVSIPATKRVTPMSKSSVTPSDRSPTLRCAVCANQLCSACRGRSSWMPTTCRKIAMTSARPNASMLPSTGRASSSSVRRRRSAPLSSARIGDAAVADVAAPGGSAAMRSDAATASGTGPRQNHEMRAFCDYLVHADNPFDRAVELHGPFTLGDQQVRHMMCVEEGLAAVQVRVAGEEALHELFGQFCPLNLEGGGAVIERDRD